MTEKEVFMEKMIKSTKQFAADMIRFCDSLINSKASSVITYQLVKSATSTGASYRRIKSLNHYSIVALNHFIIIALNTM